MGTTTEPSADGPTPVPEPIPPTRTAPATASTEPSLGTLFRELAQETTVLIRQEVDLARTEMRQNIQSFARDAGMLAAGGGVLLLAALVFTAFLVAAVGDLLGNEYWLGALLIGVLYAAIGGILIARGRKGLRGDDLKPDQAIESLQADRRWAQAEARQVKRDLTS